MQDQYIKVLEELEPANKSAVYSDGVGLLRYDVAERKVTQGDLSSLYVMYEGAHATPAFNEACMHRERDSLRN